MPPKEGSTRSYPELGFSDPHHPLTHHRNNEEWIEKVTRINRHHVEQFAYLVGRLKSIKEGDATLLDNSMLLFCSSMMTGNHNADQLPVIVLCGAGGRIRGGQVIDYTGKPDRQMCRLYLSMMDKMNVRLPKFGDASAPLEEV